MRRNIKRSGACFLSFILSVCATSCTFNQEDISSSGFDQSSSSTSILEDSSVFENIKNVILLIGDGMGPNQIRAGELYRKEKLCMQGFPYCVKVQTGSLSDAITDSAAAATAMATGKRTHNGKIGLDSEGMELFTIVDYAKAYGKRTAILTTEELYGATPMGFSGHSTSRTNYNELIRSAAISSNVDFFASYTTDGYEYIFENAGYTKIEEADNISEATEDKIFGFYNIKADAPSMTNDWKVSFDYIVKEALDYLSQDEDGFFLMAEGAHIDHGGHSNSFNYMIEELLAFDDAVKVVYDWAKERDDTIVLVTADHETGGFTINEPENNDELTDEERYELPLTYYWTASGHTSISVNCYVYGANIDFSKYSLSSNTLIKNTDIFQIMKQIVMQN